jgi:hypothetical protein
MAKTTTTKNSNNGKNVFLFALTILVAAISDAYCNSKCNWIGNILVLPNLIHDIVLFC